jgi:hypothetical protein
VIQIDQGPGANRASIMLRRTISFGPSGSIYPFIAGHSPDYKMENSDESLILAAFAA